MILIRTGCLNIHRTHTTANNSTNNNVVFFFVSDLKIVGRVFANGPGDQGSIPSRVIPKTLKMVLDTSLLNTHWYKVRIKGKVKQYGERCSARP